MKKHKSQTAAVRAAPRSHSAQAGPLVEGSLRSLKGSPGAGEKLKRTPWLDKVGRPLPLGRLRQRSKKWSVETWRLYLEFLSPQETCSLGSRMSDKNFEAELKGMTYEIDECLEGPADHSPLHMAIQLLPPIQRAVIQKLFWEGLTIREAALDLKISRSTAQRLKSQALSTLYTKIRDRSPLVRGKVVFLPVRERKKHAA